MPSSTGIIDPQNASIPQVPQDFGSQTAPEERQRGAASSFAEQPYGAGFMKTPGKVADIASNIMQGWMAGVRLKEKRKLDVAQNNVLAANYSVATQKEKWQQVMTDPNASDQDKAGAKAAYDQAVEQRHQIMAQYVEPEPGQKKGKGGKKEKEQPGFLHRMFLGADPHLIAGKAEEALYSSQKNWKPSLTPEDKLAQEKLSDYQQERKDRNDWRTLASKDPSKLTADERQNLDRLELQLFGRDPQETKVTRMKAGLTEKFINGTATDADKQMGISLGLFHPRQLSTFSRTDASGHDILYTVDENQNIIGKKDLGKGYIPPNQADIAHQMMNDRVNTLKKWLKEIHGPKSGEPWTDEQVNQFAVSNVLMGYGQFGRGPGSAWSMNNPARAKAAEQAMNTALKTVWSQASDDEKKLWKLFVTPTGHWNDKHENEYTGNLMYSTAMVAPQKIHEGHWFKPDEDYETYRGVRSTPSDIVSEEAKMRKLLADTLKKQNPMLDDTEINAIMLPPVYMGQKGFEPTMSATPQGSNQMQSAPAQDMAPPPQAPQASDNTLGLDLQ